MQDLDCKDRLSRFMKVNYHSSSLLHQTSSLFQLSRFGFVNAYLFAERDRTFTLIDTGISSGHAVTKEAGKLGRPIARVVLTHAHVDHVGSLDYLTGKFPGIEVAMSTREARLLQRDFSLDPDEPSTKIKGRFLRCRTRPTRLVTEGDKVGSLSVVFSPGHTPGHICLFDPISQILFSGDALHSMFGGVSVASTPKPLFPFLSWGTWDAPTALESGRRLLALEPEVLAPGHGPIVIKPAEAMRQAIEQETARLG
ncbi:MAG TPA: MBL fold metallo-hydrolase [Chthoniobacterales bacterium]|nr:MBL fold metallo-hydrolase [Chthoniobacterales bacterium]